MTSENQLQFNFDKGHKKAVRPKLLKLTDVQMPNRSRKKNKFKVIYVYIIHIILLKLDVNISVAGSNNNFTKIMTL